MYTQFVRFLVPLVLAMMALEVSTQFLNGGMARVPRAVETLAAFGLALGLTNVISSPLSQARQVGLALIDNGSQLQTGLRTVVAIGVGLSASTAILGTAGPGRWVVEDVHGITPSLADQVQAALLWLAPLPLINGLVRYYSGLLARVRRTGIVSVSALAGIGVRIASVVLLLGMDWVQSRPILLPSTVMLAGALTECLVLVAGHLRYAGPALPRSGEPITVSAILIFLWPLAAIMIFQGASRPLINLVVSRGVDATQALAALTIVFTLGHVHYGWVNEIRSVAPAFRDEPGAGHYIRRFAVACCAVSFSLGVVLFWTPVRELILLDLIGVDAAVAQLCVWPLVIFSFFPFAVALRTYYHGVGLVRRITDAMAWSGPCRMAAIVVALAVLSRTGLPGATVGVAALLCGFGAEAAAVAWGVRRRLRARTAAESSSAPGRRHWRLWAAACGRQQSRRSDSEGRPTASEGQDGGQS